jgi:putative two-component system response regulator
VQTTPISPPCRSTISFEMASPSPVPPWRRVSSGPAPLERASEPGRYDAFVLDGMMPGMDGYEVCRRLKADPVTAHVPVVFLTAKTQRTEQERALEAGAVACLIKPFDPMTVSAALREALAPVFAARPERA